ncbi:hypothetical protein OG481_29750 [Streptomyces longwoodensis]|uniref:YVTN family beta-propeller repeat protein n=1 Tax=Streptomyces longwoodensis TaxID=68231 RepID=UPI002DDBD0B6|nr:hypothetical protein [Streptomyces longwoodensis]WRY92434.1 hypothetical protein OG481_29750 [Streptomyces longwoodensis]WUC69585.1 hypothetical protein OG416_01580 [Streptomyces longwoodensis]
MVDTATRTVTSTVPTGTAPHGVAVSPDGSLVYVANHDGNSVSVVDAATGATTATVPAGAGPEAVAFHPSGTRAYVTDGNAGTVTVLDTATATVASTITVGSRPLGVAFAPPTADLGVALTATGVPGLPAGRITYTVTLTDNGPSPLTSGTVTATLPAGTTATTSSCTPVGSRVTCTVGALAPGATTTRTFTVPLGALTLGLPYTVTVQRTASSPTDPDPADDTASRTCTVITSLIINCG